MKLVVDMNLSTDWVDYLRGLGHDVVHWSDLGAADTADEDILAWARAHDHAVLTNDLDFGTLLVMTGASKPTVLQLRTQLTLSAHVGPLVARAIDETQDGLAAGALVTIEANRLRIRSLTNDFEE